MIDATPVYNDSFLNSYKAKCKHLLSEFLQYFYLFIHGHLSTIYNAAPNSNKN